MHGRIHSRRLVGTVVVGLLLSCSGDREATPLQIGSVGLGISLPDEVGDISSVRFAISGNGYGAPGSVTNRIEDVNVSRSHTASAQIGGIPAGDGYTLALTASSSTGIQCSGETIFNVTAGRTSRVALHLACRLPDGVIVRPPTTTGSVNVAADVVTPTPHPPVICPLISSVAIMPSEVKVGETLTLDVQAFSLDYRPLTYTWTEVNGNPAFPPIFSTNGMATYRCQTPGTYTLRLAVSNGFSPCDTTFRGIVGDEQIIRCTEPDPTAGAGGAAGHDGIGGMNSNGGQATGGTNASSGTSSSTAIPCWTLRTTVEYWGGADCWSCVVDNCSSYDSTVGLDVVNENGCDRFPTLTQREHCYSVLACEMRTDCGNLSTLDASGCYCGTSTNCIGGVDINGPCRTVIEAGFQSNDPQQIAYTYNLPSIPGGSANALYQCMLNGVEYGGPDYTGDVRCRACFSATPAVGPSSSSTIGACPSWIDAGGSTGMGGTSATGGAIAAGGTTSTGGSPGSGGSVVTSSTPASGGRNAGSTAGTYGRGGSDNGLEPILVDWGGDDCWSCAVDNCASVESTVGADVVNENGCDSFATQAGRERCYSLLACEMRTDCADLPSMSTVGCYCGTSTDCLGGVGINGACKAETEAGFYSSDPIQIALNFNAPSIPGGSANALYQCLLIGVEFGGPEYTGDSRCRSCFSTSP